jgi:hypothetical protein
MKYNNERCFLRGPCQEFINGTGLEFSLVVEYYSAGDDVSIEAEESSFLEAVTRKRLLVTVTD